MLHTVCICHTKRMRAARTDECMRFCRHVHLKKGLRLTRIFLSGGGSTCSRQLAWYTCLTEGRLVQFAFRCNTMLAGVFKLPSMALWWVWHLEVAAEHSL
jgi:hypothetical protein